MFGAFYKTTVMGGLFFFFVIITLETTGEEKMCDREIGAQVGFELGKRKMKHFR